jgi:hypothetical protein
MGDASFLGVRRGFWRAGDLFRSLREERVRRQGMRRLIGLLHLRRRDGGISGPGSRKRLGQTELLSRVEQLGADMVEASLEGADMGGAL